MKRFPLMIGMLVSIAGTLFAQAPDTLWTKTFGGSSDDWGYSIQQTAEGGYIIAGSTESFGAGSTDAWLIRTDANGDTLWTRTFGDTAKDAAHSVQQTTDGGFIIAGTTESFGGGSSDAWLIRTDAGGNLLWHKTFGDSSYDEGWSAHQTADGGYVMTGSRGGGGFIFFYSAMWLIKTDADGDTLWTRSYSRDALNGGYSVQQTADGGYIIAGYFACFDWWHPCYSLTWAVRTDAVGDTLWTREFGTRSSLFYSFGYSVQQTSDGGFVVAGNGGISHGPLFKLDTDGNTVWMQNFNISGYAVQETADGGFITTGRDGGGNGDVGLIRTDADGSTLWTKTFGGVYDDEGRSVQQTNEGGYIVAGSTGSFGAGGNDIRIIKVMPEATGIDEATPAKPDDYRLLQNYPNPFNPNTTIEFHLPRAGFVTLKIYNLLGQEVTVALAEYLPAGNHRYVWNAEGLPGGIYFYNLKTINRSITHKALLIK